MSRFIRHIILFVIAQVFIVLGGPLGLFAQVKRTVSDTATVLPQVVVEGFKAKGILSNKRFSVGTRAEVFSAERLQPFKDQSLAEYLQRNSAVYMKEFGKGMGAYISVRGTSASHTSVQWNGMSLDVPTMGQTDFSHLPLMFFDAMDLHVGGGSTLYGNGSIGGSVQLSTRPLWQEGLHGQVKVGLGSFQNYFTGANLRYGFGPWESRTSLIYNSAKNHFEFANNTQIDKPKEQQQHAAFQNWGILQEVYKKTGRNNQLSMHLWYLNFDRDIQPSVSNNDRPETHTSLHDKNLKISGAYKGKAGKFKFSTHAGYSHDWEQYEQDIIAADRLLASGEGEMGAQKWTLKAGGNVEYVHPTGKSFAAATEEWRSDIYALGLWKPLTRLAVNAGIRPSFVSDLRIAPDPSLGFQWALWQKPQQHLAIRASYSQSHKIPTLNDRYWGGENKYLRPEHALTWEAGVDYEGGVAAWQWDLHGTVYYSQVEDWIRWFPAGVVWRPQNIPLVDASGAEASVQVKGTAGPVLLKMNGSYAYTHVETKEGLWESDPGVGHQLAYQPYHCFSAIITGVYRFVSLDIQTRYTGERTTNDIYDVLPAYQLWNLQLSLTKAWARQKGTIQFQVNNLFNKDYQNVKFYAMPGRNFMLNLQYTF